MNTSRDDAEFDPFANDRAKRKSGRSSRGAAWLALLLALLVAGYNGYQWWQAREAEAAGSGLQRSVSSLQSQAAALQTRLAEIETAVAADDANEVDSELDALQSGFEALQSRLAANAAQDAGLQAELDAINTALLRFQQRLERLEAGVAALAEQNAAPGRNLDIAEVAYLLRLAEERLELFGDVGSAELALAKADAQLLALEDPLYQPVRRRIAAARQALQLADNPDIPGLAARVSDLQERVASLPFEAGAPPPALTSPADEQAGFWQKIKSALSPLVTVRRRDADRAPLSLADGDLVRQAFWLQLEAARLALARQDSHGWRQSLDRARSTLEQSFDADAALVRSAIQEVQDLQSIELRPALPDIGDAWAQLRMLQADGPAPAAAGEPEAAVPEPAIEAANPDDGGDAGG